MKRRAGEWDLRSRCGVTARADSALGAKYPGRRVVPRLRGNSSKVEEGGGGNSVASEPLASCLSRGDLSAWSMQVDGKPPEHPTTPSESAIGTWQTRQGDSVAMKWLHSRTPRFRVLSASGSRQS